MISRKTAKMRAKVALACVLSISGCNGSMFGTRTPRQTSGAAAAAARVDRMSQVVEEYGSVSVSSPYLISLDNKEGRPSPMRFQLARGADEYFEAARSESSGLSRSAFSAESVFKLALGLKISEKTKVQNSIALDQIEDNAKDRRQADQASDRSRSTAYAAARAEYDAAMASAAQESDDAKRLKLLADAKRAFADAVSKGSVNQSPQQAIHDAKVDAAKAELDVDLAAANAETDEAAKREKLATAKRKYASALASAEEELASQPTLVDQAVDVTLPDAEESNLAPFRDQGKPLPSVGDNLKVRDASAIVTAAGNVVREGIMTVLGDPQRFNDNTDKKVLLGVTMVSVDPGWRTGQGYRGDVSVRVSYKYLPARVEVLAKLQGDADKFGKLPPALKEAVTGLATPPVVPGLGTSGMGGHRYGILTSGIEDHVAQARATSGSPGEYSIPDQYAVRSPEAAPLVAAVSPFTDVQTTDISNQYSRRRSFAMDLSFALSALGYGGAAKAFASYAEQLDKDQAQKVDEASVVTYSNSGGVFGFTVAPSRTMIATRGNAANAASDLLRRQTFPALIMIAFDADDLAVKFGYQEGKLLAYEPVLFFEQTTRWLPVDGQEQRMSEVDRLEFAPGGNTSRSLLTTTEFLALRNGITCLKTVAADRMKLEAISRDIDAKNKAIEGFSGQLDKKPADGEQKQLKEKKETTEGEKRALTSEYDAYRRNLVSALECLQHPTLVEAVTANKISYSDWEDAKRALEAALGISVWKARYAEGEQKGLEDTLDTFATKYGSEIGALSSGLSAFDAKDFIAARERILEMQLLASGSYQAIPISAFGFQDASKNAINVPIAARLIPEVSDAPVLISVVGSDFPADAKTVSVSALGTGNVTIANAALLSDRLIQFKLTPDKIEQPTAVIFEVKFSDAAGDGIGSVMRTPPFVVMPAKPQQAGGGKTDRPNVTRTVEKNEKGETETISGSDASLVNGVISRDSPPKNGDSASVNVQVTSPPK